MCTRDWVILIWVVCLLGPSQEEEKSLLSVQNLQKKPADDIGQLIDRKGNTDFIPI